MFSLFWSRFYTYLDEDDLNNADMFIKPFIWQTEKVVMFLLQYTNDKFCLRSLLL